MKNIAILGSTGSIGTSTLKVVDHLPEDLNVVALAAASNVDLLEQQARKYRPEIVALFDEGKAKDLQERLADTNIEILAGIEGVCAVAELPSAHFVVSAIVGIAGLLPTVRAIKARKTIGLANKEVMVAAGDIVTKLAKEYGVKIIPIDSEHNAVFQCLEGEKKKTIGRIILTASGGPFREYSTEQLEKISVEAALKHPTWNMGPKVTIDSSTLMNKGLEVIEAFWLFDVDIESIDVVMHPQSIIHSMVEFCDGSIIAQLNKPDMVNPIQHAMSYPNRLPTMLPPFDFTKYQALSFHVPDTKKFRCLDLAYNSIREGGSAPCYLNAANEIMVQRFLEGEISWMEIGEYLEALMCEHDKQSISTIEDVLEIDALARQLAKTFKSYQRVL